jgi:hypothetical protein
MLRRNPIVLRSALGSLLAALALAAYPGVSPAGAQTARWDIVTRSAPTYLIPEKPGEIEAVLVNLGDAPVIATPGNPVVITDALPAGVVATNGMVGEADTGGGPGSERPRLSCAGLRCTYVGTLPPMISLEVSIPVRAKATLSGELGENEVRVEGGEFESGVERAAVSPQIARRALTASPTETPFGVERYELNPEEANGSLDLQAGSHPFQLTTTLELNQTYGRDPAHPEVELPAAPALLRNLITKLPPGLAANTTVIPQCSNVDFSTIRTGDSNTCAPDTTVGAALVTFKEPVFETRTETVPVFNLVPAPGEPARFGFEFDQVPVVLDTAVRTGEGYGVEVKVANAPESAEVLGTILTVWGVPGDSSHDNARGWECLGGGHFVEHLEPRPPCQPLRALNPPPYLLLPTAPCAQPLATSVEAQSWEPGAGYLPPFEAPGKTLGGCGKLPFDASISVATDRHEASTPTGMTVEVKVPQNTTLSSVGLGEADIKDTALALPEGLTANAGAADGLATCGVAETGFLGLGTDTGSSLERDLTEQRFNREGVACPDASKIGEVAIDSPLLENEIKGFVYLGQQDTNPFASPLVLYLIAEDPVSGVRVKLAGEVMIDPNTGRLISVFRNAPPLPFQTLKLHLFDGARASQSTPPQCGSYQAIADFTLWKELARGELVTAQAGEKPGEGFQITSGPGGSPCPAGTLPFAPSMVAGSTNTQAGAFTPFELTINRPDGNQALTGLTLRLPPGAAAVLASVTPCPIAQADAALCGPGSEIGHSTASSGLGGDPYTLPGVVYLTEGFDGAPFGVSVKTPAIAGPFNLGTVIADSTIQVDPTTAAATIAAVGARILEPDGNTTMLSSPLPTIVKGVPVQLKQLHVTVDRANFEFNPTHCAPRAVSATLTGAEGASTAVSSPFQVANCASLPFSPQLTAEVSGHGSKLNGISLTVRVKAAPGQANIEKTFLTLPSQLPSRLTTIQKACLAAVFEANPAACDEGSVIGMAIAHTPVLRRPLVGPAYLVSHGNVGFPDVEFVLQGEGVTIVLDGKTDIKKGITYSRFETVPDAPVSTFETVLPAGPHSALTANVPESENYSLCKTSLSMPTEITGQNGALVTQTTHVKVTGCGGVLGFKAKLTRAQLLAKALKVCRKKYKANKKLRASCEAHARKKYRAKSAKKVKKAATRKKR